MNFPNVYWHVIMHSALYHSLWNCRICYWASQELGWMRRIYNFLTRLKGLAKGLIVCCGQTLSFSCGQNWSEIHLIEHILTPRMRGPRLLVHFIFLIVFTILILIAAIIRRNILADTAFTRISLLTVQTLELVPFHRGCSIFILCRFPTAFVQISSDCSSGF